ncbi:gamma-glutamyltransferase family protein [Prochlorococcus sp. MIT 1307]|uniref:gamma-glutamyltransferase family protein n=1 Tax=Prochlorococcus sp. MIT 1307 TaxID=3096219 RepID=UPI002A749BDB|nr:gamma-glutamyltransferase family protein [Prochlorococcus sp. MIT 1307]
MRLLTVLMTTMRVIAPLVTLVVPISSQVNWDAPESLATSGKTVSTASGQAVVVTANPLASDAALRTLEKGGTAMDAVITAQTVLAVVEPQSSGLGGGSFLLYWDNKEKLLYALDGRETASAQATEITWLDLDGKPVSWLTASQSLSSIGVPGTTALLWEGHQRFGRLPWKTDLSASIRLAYEGFLPSPRFLRSISLAKRIGIKHAENFQSLYFPDGSPPSATSLFRNKNLGLTLNQLAAGGLDEFYRGGIAKRLIADLDKYQNRDKPLQTITARDLENYRVYERKPLCRLYRSWKICTIPPPSGGGIAVLQALGIYESLTEPNGLDGPASYWHFLAESLRFADADRSHWIGDPIDWPVPLEGLLEDNYLQKRANKIKLNKATAFPLPGRPKGGELLDLASQPRTAGGGTTHLVVVDRDGNVASYTASVETVFGSRHISGGMVLNNQLTDFSFLSNVSGKPIANRIGPNKRPMSSMSPMIVFQNNRPVMALGSPGGWLIPHYVTHALIRSLDFALSPKDVVRSRHLSVKPNQTLLERNSESSTPDSMAAHVLKSFGHQIKYSRFSSGLALIHWKEGTWYGAADPRREGKAVSLP